ncbi:MAG: hypothetical protein HN855_09815 [Anaerolineae bacterium]|nr:hypothetical protein [Anaerolineae bacterium]MBT7325445.1 hypothetical protein [Anaerolineae bacterium]
MIISVAILGIGLGAAVVQRMPAEKIDHQIRLSAWSASFGILLLALFFALPWIFDPRLLFTLLSLLIYACIGAISATLFRAWSSQSEKLYAADLTGGALGALLALVLLNLTSGITALLLLPLLLSIAAIFLTSEKKIPRILPILFALIFAQNALWQPLQIDPAHLPTPKPLTRQLNEKPATQIVYTTQDALGRVDVVANAQNPAQKLVFMDGAAGSVMYANPETQTEIALQRADLGYFPFLWILPENALIIGPGGGKDILFAHLADVREIDAVEVSRGVTDALYAFADYNGNLANLPEVNLVVDEGRSYLRRSQKDYELIYLSEVTSLSSELAGYMLTENYIYTTEAMQDYLSHLSADGWLAIKLYDEFTLTRAFTTVIQALVENGSSEAEAARHVVVLLDPQALSQEEPFRNPLLLVARDPITLGKGEELLRLVESMRFIPVFIPHVVEQGAPGAVAQGQTTITELVSTFERGDIRPTSDTAPFFYEFNLGLPPLLKNLWGNLAVFLLITLGYLAWQKPKLSMLNYAAENIYFFGLGIGFMLIEAGLLQHLSLFLGHPSLNLSVVLLALLLSSGLGSWLSQLLPAIKKNAPLFVAIIVIVQAFMLPPLLQATLQFPFWGRIGLAWLLILPLGIVLGMPFPTGLAKTQQSFVPFAWGVNGVGSVVGAVAAISLAMRFGFQAVFLLGGGIYILIAALTGRLGR